MTNWVGTRTCPTQAKGSKVGSPSGLVSTTRLFQPEPYRPPYSMNHRKAVWGVSADGMDAWWQPSPYPAASSSQNRTCSPVLTLPAGML